MENSMNVSGPPLHIMKVLGFAVRIPPKKSIDQFPPDTLEGLIERIKKRYSEDGRQLFAESVCRDLSTFGYRVPKEFGEKEIVWHSPEECCDYILNMDYEAYPDEAVRDALEFLENCLHPQTQQPSVTPTA